MTRLFGFVFCGGVLPIIFHYPVRLKLRNHPPILNPVILSVDSLNFVCEFLSKTKKNYRQIEKIMIHYNTVG